MYFLAMFSLYFCHTIPSMLNHSRCIPAILLYNMTSKKKGELYINISLITIAKATIEFIKITIGISGHINSVVM